MKKRNQWFGGVLAAILLMLTALPSALAVSASTVYIVLYRDKTEAYVNDKTYQLDSPATIKNGFTYVPAKFLGDSMGFEVKFDPATKIITMNTLKAKIVINQSAKTATVNGSPVQYSQFVKLSEQGRLLVQLRWVSDYMGATARYESSTGKIELTYLGKAEGVETDAGDSIPVAKFIFSKPAYRIGERVNIIDLSYDADGESLTSSFSGKQDVYFQPGTYEVRLKVTDKSGNVSREFKRSITITGEVFLSQEEYPYYFAVKPFLTNVKALLAMPQTPKTVSYDSSRKLLVSDSPEIIKQTGILYEDSVNGKARLYANHQNGLDMSVQFAILATNRTDRDVKVTTTNKGEVFPTRLALLMGSIASTEFLLNEPVQEERELVLKPGESKFYKLMPDFSPSKGVNAIYDVETDGEVTFSFLAMESGAGVESYAAGSYSPLSYDGHVRGTFDSSEIQWEIDGSGINRPVKVSIGDSANDTFVNGTDVFRNQSVVNKGNYGVTYNILIHQPKKMAIAVAPRGGIFKGPFKINGEMVLAPQSGTLTPQDTYVLKRTKGNEAAVMIEFTPPAGSNFPIHLVLYPLKETE